MAGYYDIAEGLNDLLFRSSANKPDVDLITATITRANPHLKGTEDFMNITLPLKFLVERTLPPHDRFYELRMDALNRLNAPGDFLLKQFLVSATEYQSPSSRTWYRFNVGEIMALLEITPSADTDLLKRLVGSYEKKDGNWLREWIRDQCIWR